MVKAEFEQDVGVLRGLIKKNGYETDPYKIIILIERYILEYGMVWTRRTVVFLRNKEPTQEEKQSVILETLQTRKTIEELLIYKYYKDGRIKG